MALGNSRPNLPAISANNKSAALRSPPASKKLFSLSIDERRNTDRQIGVSISIIVRLFVELTPWPELVESMGAIRMGRIFPPIIRSGSLTRLPGKGYGL